MYSSSETKELVEKSLKGLVYPSSPSELYAPISYSLSLGGKRMRPVLALMTCNMFTDRITDKCILPALGLEVYHGFTLLHDDIMDNADLRRNQVAVHKKWGQNIAILSGDAMSIDAFRLISQAERNVMPEVMQTFTKAAMEVCEGQQYDMNFESKGTITEEDYLKMIGLKTASLIAASMRIGAIVGGASNADIEKITAVGQNLGLAFQIQDDLLDTYSDSKKTGKNSGLDIANNKKTFLLTSAIRLAKGEQKKELTALLKDKEVPADEKYTKVKAIFDDLKVKDLAEVKIKEYFNTVHTGIDSVEVKNERKTLLKEYIDNLLNRQN